MTLNFFVQGEHVAYLERPDGFQHELTYLTTARADQFFSLTMPVQTATWTWPALPPFFQVSLPEGFLLSGNSSLAPFNDVAYRRTDGEPVFVDVPAPTDEELQALLHMIITRLMKLLTRRGVLIEEEVEEGKVA